MSRRIRGHKPEQRRPAEALRAEIARDLGEESNGMEDYRDEHPYRLGCAVGAIRLALIELEGRRPNVAGARDVLERAAKADDEAGERLLAKQKQRERGGPARA